MKLKSIISVFVGLSLTAASLIATSPAAASGTPAPFTSIGESWINVSPSERIYVEDFFTSDSDQEDPGWMAYVPDGVTCTRNSISASGPMLVFGNRVNQGNCGGFDPYDPDGFNGPVRSGRVPLGFEINFFGTTFDGVYPSVDGGVTFQNPGSSSSYDRSIIELVNEIDASALGAFNVDLEYRSYSNFWYAQTTLDGAKAAVFSWENFSPYNQNVNSLELATELASFQVVFIDRGSGDFDAYLNYDTITAVAGNSLGYAGPRFWIDLSKDVNPGTNVLDTTFVEGWSGCTLAQDIRRYSNNNNASDFTDTVLVTKTIDNNFYVKTESSTTVSIWEDSGCSTTPINLTVLQDVGTDGNAFVEYEAVTYVNDLAAAIGWGTYTASPFGLDVHEFFPNVSIDRLKDGGDEELISQSINTTVKGRIVIGQRGGVTIGEPLDPDTAPFATPRTSSFRPYYGPVSRPLAKTPAVAGEQVTVKGYRLDTVESVTSGDINLPIVSKGTSALVLMVPIALAGAIDISLHWVNGERSGKYRIPDALLVSAPEISESEAVEEIKPKPEQEQSTPFLVSKLFANYLGDVGAVVESDRLQIAEFIESYSGIQRVTCVGRTSGVPAIDTDEDLALARATNACGIVSDLVPDASVNLKTSTGQGIGQRFRSVIIYISGRD